MSSGQELQQGTIISDRYRVEACLEIGSLGSDFRAHDEFTDSPVLLKLFSEKLVTDGFMERVEQKSRLLASISESHVLRITDFGMFEAKPYIVTPFPPGQTLGAVISAGKLNSLELVLEIAKQVCSALHSAHELDIVHGSIAPDCILLSEDITSPSVYLFNFGLSGFLTDTAEGGAVSSSGQIIGKPEYLSPEHIRGEEISVRSDIYCLGLVLYEMLCGYPPFRAEGSGAEAVMDLLMRQASDPAPSFPSEQSRFSIPRALEELVLEMLSKDTLARPSNLVAIAHQLQLSDIPAEHAEPETIDSGEAETQFESCDPLGTEDTYADIPAEEIAHALGTFEDESSGEDKSRTETTDDLLHSPSEFADVLGRTTSLIDTGSSIDTGDSISDHDFSGLPENIFPPVTEDDLTGITKDRPLFEPDAGDLGSFEPEPRTDSPFKKNVALVMERLRTVPKPALAACALVLLGIVFLFSGGSDEPTEEDRLASSFPDDGESGLGSEPESASVDEAKVLESETIDEEDPAETASTNSAPTKIGKVNLQAIILNSTAGRQLEASYKELYLQAKKAPDSKEQMKKLNQVNTKVVGQLLIDLREIISDYGKRKNYAIILGNDLELATAPFVNEALSDPVGTLTSTSKRESLDSVVAKEFNLLYEEP